MTVAGIHCANCTHPIPPEYWNDPAENTCRGCGEPVVVRVFQALRRGLAKIDAAHAGTAVEGDATCFHHPQNPAVIACDECGRFLCSLCDLDLDGRHLCSICLDRGIHVEKADTLEERRVQYDTLALHLLFWPIFTIWLPLFGAPAALFFVIRNWKTRMSILPRGRFRLWLALLLALAETVGILAFIGFLILAAQSVPTP